jgi:uncharacterized membrane protein YidH (DUF202 family)
VSRTWPRALLMGGALLLWAVMVSGPVQQWVYRADLGGCVGPHLTEVLGLMVAGMVSGLAIGPATFRWARWAAAAVLPRQAERQQTASVKAAAVVVIVVSMVFVLPWVSPEVDRFVSLHTLLAVEAFLVVYLMGTLAGAAWHALWERQAWVGVVLSLAMILMVMANTLSRHAWC